MKLMFQDPDVKKQFADVFLSMPGITLSRGEMYATIDSLDEEITAVMMLPPKKRLKAVEKLRNKYRALLEEEIQAFNKQKKSAIAD